MAPVGIDATVESVLGSANGISSNTMVAVAVIGALAAGLSLFLTLVICCCCKKTPPPIALDAGAGPPVDQMASAFFPTDDPNAPDFCPDCAAAAAEGQPPTPSQIGAPMSEQSGAGGGPAGTVKMEMGKAGTVMHKYAHKANVSWLKSQMKSASNPNYQTLAVAQSNVFDAAKKGGGGAMAGKGPSESQMSKAAANPAYQTLFQAKSGVFSQQGPPAKGGQVQATQALGTKSASNPAYQTLFGAQSDIFSKKGGPKKGGGAFPPEQSGGYRG